MLFSDSCIHLCVVCVSMQEPGRTGSQGDGDGDGESWECRCQDAGTPRHTEDDGPELVSVTQHCITASFAQVAFFLPASCIHENVFA